MINREYKPAEQLAFLRQLKTLTPVQLLTLLVFLECQSRPDRAQLILRILQS